MVDIAFGAQQLSQKDSAAGGTTYGMQQTFMPLRVNYTGVMHTALDSAQKTWVTCISALDESGAALWATRTYSNYKN